MERTERRSLRTQNLETAQKLKFWRRGNCFLPFLKRLIHSRSRNLPVAMHSTWARTSRNYFKSGGDKKMSRSVVQHYMGKRFYCRGVGKLIPNFELPGSFTHNKFIYLQLWLKWIDNIPSLTDKKFIYSKVCQSSHFEQSSISKFYTRAVKEYNWMWLTYSAASMKTQQEAIVSIGQQIMTSAHTQKDNIVTSELASKLWNTG